MHHSGIAPSKMMRNFMNDDGLIENVGFLHKDLYNYLYKIKREEIEDGDAETLMVYLYEKQEYDPLF